MDGVCRAAASSAALRQESRGGRWPLPQGGLTSERGLRSRSPIRTARCTTQMRPSLLMPVMRADSRRLGPAAATVRPSAAAALAISAQPQQQLSQSPPPCAGRRPARKPRAWAEGIPRLCGAPHAQRAPKSDSGEGRACAALARGCPGLRALAASGTRPRPLIASTSFYTSPSQLPNSAWPAHRMPDREASTPGAGAGCARPAQAANVDVPGSVVLSQPQLPLLSTSSLHALQQACLLLLISQPNRARCRPPALPPRRAPLRMLPP